MRAVAALAESVPHVNSRDATAAQTAQRVRARFRAVVSMVGLPVVFNPKGQVMYDPRILVWHAYS